MGTRARARGLCRISLRRTDLRQRALGLLGRFDWPVPHQFRRGRGYPCGVASHVALEIAHCAWRRPRSIDALASTDRPVHEVEADQGPVMVTVEYRIDPNSKQFLQALDKVERERRRDGAYAWCVFEDAAEQGRMIETFLVESWTEHLRQHERVTNADRLIDEKVLHFDIHGPPRVTHLIAADADRVHVKKSPK